jgi:hypothetical protein
MLRPFRRSRAAIARLVFLLPAVETREAPEALVEMMHGECAKLNPTNYVAVTRPAPVREALDITMGVAYDGAASNRDSRFALNYQRDVLHICPGRLAKRNSPKPEGR